jgi:hypothetical protein
MQLSAFRARTRTKADEGNSDFYQPEQLDASINAACRFVYRKLTQIAEDFFIREGTTLNTAKFDTVVGQSGYDLPADQMKLVKVESRPTSSSDEDDYLPVEKINIAANDGESYYPQREGYLPYFGYFLAGEKIYFRPTPRQSFTVRLWDIPRFTSLSADSDTPPFEEDWDELVCELAALDLLGTSGEPIFQERFKLYQEQMGLLNDTATHRDQRAQTMVMDFNEVGVVR